MSRVEFLYRGRAYHPQNNHVSKTKDEIYKYPILYHARKNDITFLWSKVNNRGHFGIPKVIMSTGISTPIIDYKGEYGMSPFAYAIVDEPDKLPLIQKALLNKDFLKLMKCSWGRSSGHRYNKKLIKLLKKDFYLKYI